MLDWLIIGGGIHGSYLSLFLTQRKGIAADRLRVLDPYAHPLALWQHFTSNTGMTYLRSSHAHNLHFDPFSLITLTRTQAGQPLADFIEPYGRPALTLFNAHSQRLIERYHLQAVRVRGRAQALSRQAGGWRVETGSGCLDAKNVILAFGNSERPHWPQWAQDARTAGANIHHLFDPAYQRSVPEGKTVVVGGGITAAQVATTLSIDSPGSVTLLMRHSPRLHQFDTDLGWITYRYLDGFHQETDYAHRREMIQAARHRGSMPADVVRELDQAVQHGLLKHRIDEVAYLKLVDPLHTKPMLLNSEPHPLALSGIGIYLNPTLNPSPNMGRDFKAHPSFTGYLPPNPSPCTERGIVEELRFQGAKPMTLELASGETLPADHIILATGFETNRPGGGWLDTAIDQYGLPHAGDGYPIVNQQMCWSPGLFVSGALAELEVGPVARNFVGVKLAAERIGDSL